MAPAAVAIRAQAVALEVMERLHGVDNHKVIKVKYTAKRSRDRYANTIYNQVAAKRGPTVTCIIQRTETNILKWLGNLNNLPLKEDALAG